MSDKRVLLVSYAFPPLAVPEAYLSAKTMGAIPGFETDVICADAEDGWGPRDDGFLDYIVNRFANVVCVRLGWSRRKILELGPRFAGPPDPLRALTGGAVAAFRQMARRPYAAIVTWSQWHSSHLVGLKLKKDRPELPWIAHFSDPWVDNPYVTYNPADRVANQKLEAQVFANADALAFTTDECAQLMLEKYPAQFEEKATVIPHPFDPSLYPAGDSSNSGGCILRYVGDFYGIRTPLPLFRALRQVRERSPHLLKGVRVELIGSCERDFRDDQDFRCLEPGLVTFMSRVSYQESFRLMAQADGLLIIDAPMELSPFLPSKLVDYIGTFRPVFGITPPGASRRLIQKLGGVVAEPNEPHRMGEALERFLTRLKDPAHHSGGDLQVARGYHVDVVRRQVGALIDRVIEHVHEAPVQYQGAEQ